MTNIQKKSLEHISKTLKGFNTYPTYSATEKENEKSKD